MTTPDPTIRKIEDLPDQPRGPDEQSCDRRHRVLDRRPAASLQRRGAADDHLLPGLPGRNLQNNQLLISGSVNGRGAPITDATVISSGTTLRTARAFPTPIDADGGSYAINMNGLLQQGQQTITLTATNCAGTTTSSPRTVTYSPLPASTQFRQLGAVEVNQAVQDYNNTVPLIAGGPNGTKRTIARVYLGAEGGRRGHHRGQR